MPSDASGPPVDLAPLPPHLADGLADLTPAATATADAIAASIGDSPEAWRGVDIILVQVAAADLAGRIIGKADAFAALTEVVTALAAHPAARLARQTRKATP